jgi:hypothetical protein
MAVGGNMAWGRGKLLTARIYLIAHAEGCCFVGISAFPQWLSKIDNTSVK